MVVNEDMFDGDIELNFPDESGEIQEEAPSGESSDPKSEIDEIVEANKDQLEKEETEEGSQEDEQEGKKPSSSDRETPSDGIESQEEEESSTEQPEDHSSTSPYKSFAKANFEEGVLSEFSEEDFDKLVDETGSPGKAMIELNKRTIEKSFNEWKEDYESSLPPQLKTALQAHNDGVPFEKALGAVNKQERYNSIDEEALESDEDLQKRIIREDLTDRGFSAEEIDENIEVYEDTNILSKRAKGSLGRLKKSEEEKLANERTEAKKLEDQRREQNKKAVEDIRKNIYSTKEIVPGKELSKREQEDIYKTMMEPVAKDSSGRSINKIVELRNRNPVEFDKTLAHLVNLGVLNIDKEGNSSPDWSKIMKITKSNTLKDFEKSVQKTSDYQTGRSKRVTNDDVGDADFLNTIPKPEGF